MGNNDREIQDLRGALLKANQEIEKLSKIKSDFISIISPIYQNEGFIEDFVESLYSKVVNKLKKQNVAN